MYYPGLFETATHSYPALNSAVTSSTSSISPFGKVERPQPVSNIQNGIEPLSLLTLENGNKMISNLSNGSLGDASGGSPFRSGHFTSSQYRPPAATPTDHHLMASAYGSSSATENLGSSLLHEQSFLEASTPYSINPLSSYPSYPPYSLGNSVIGSAMKAPSSSTYPGHNSFYPPNGSTYSPLYPSTAPSFISDYITRSHIDANKAAYTNSTPSDSSSFNEHLKRLQESLQSKSPKTSDNGHFQHQHYRPSSTHSAHTGSHGSTQPVRPEPIHLQPGSFTPKSTVISNHYQQPSTEVPISKVDHCDNAHKPTSTQQGNSAQSTADSNNVQLQQQPSSETQNDQSTTNSKVRDSIDQTIENCIAGNDLKVEEENTNQSTNDSTKAAEPKDGGKSKRVNVSAKQKKKQAPAKRNRSTESGGQCGAETEPETKKPKKRCKQPGNEEGKRPAVTKPKAAKGAVRKETIAKNDKSKSKSKKKSSSVPKEESKEPLKDSSSSTAKTSTEVSEIQKEESTQKVELPHEEQTKVQQGKSSEPKTGSKKEASKKSNTTGRRRRFRSGLDMIRPSRKRPPSKPKVESNNAKKVTPKKKDISMKDFRSETKRLMVNKSLGETLLHRSARNNRMDVVRYCLQSDACDVDARDNAGYTPLHECSSRGNLEVARLLLEHSADVNASATGGIRPLHDAIENNHVEVVRLLISYGADANISTYSGTTPLQLCRSKLMFKFLKGTPVQHCSVCGK